MKITWTYEGAIEYEREKAEARGEARGIAIGEARGISRGTNLITQMNSWLADSNRSDDLLRSFKDAVFQQKLLAEYQMTHPVAASVS